jgi:hypothetical protein
VIFVRQRGALGIDDKDILFFGGDRGDGGNRTRGGRGVNPTKQAGFGSFKRSVDQDIDQPYRRRSSRADAHRRKMGESQRRIEEGCFEGGGEWGLKD